jgi:small subunit ribosomal protein S6
MALYECVFIARQDISATQVEALVGQFSGIIEENGGKVASSEMWGLRSLAYRIKKNRKGHYVLLNLDSPSPAVQEMERIMRLNEDVIRYLTVRVNELEEGPSIVMQSRHSRDDRGGRGGRGGGFRGGGGGFRGDGPRGGGGFRGDGPRGGGGGGGGGSRGDGPGAPPAAAPAEDKSVTEAKPAEKAEAKPAEKAEDKSVTEAKPAEKAEAKTEAKETAE